MVLERRLRVLLLVLPLALGWPAGSRAEDEGACLSRSIDQAAERAVHWLVERQAADGAWRSDRYGPLQHGPELTPRVARTLALLAPHSPQARQAAHRGTTYLDGLIDPQGRLGLDALEYPYPVYSSADALALLASARPSPGAPQGRQRLLIGAFQTELLRHQFTGSRRWRPEDATYGGWGYAPVPLSRPATAARDFPGANLSATVFALQALHQAGAAGQDGWRRAAQQFVFRCQNHAANHAQADPEFDDGGFFFSPVGPAKEQGRRRPGRRRPPPILFLRQHDRRRAVRLAVVRPGTDRCPPDSRPPLA